MLRASPFISKGIEWLPMCVAQVWHFSISKSENDHDPEIQMIVQSSIYAGIFPAHKDGKKALKVLSRYV